MGWLYPSKKLLIIDCAIDKNEIVSSNPTPALKMIYINLPTPTSFHLAKLVQNYNKARRELKESAVRQVIKQLNDSFIQALDAATLAVDDFVVSYPFGFNDRSNEMTRARLLKYS
jgi:hypothetical protein